MSEAMLDQLCKEKEDLDILELEFMERQLVASDPKQSSIRKSVESNESLNELQCTNNKR